MELFIVIKSITLLIQLTYVFTEPKTTYGDKYKKSCINPRTSPYRDGTMRLDIEEVQPNKLTL